MIQGAQDQCQGYEGINFLELVHTKLEFIMCEKHALAGLPYLTYADLQGQSLLFLHEGNEEYKKYIEEIKNNAKDIRYRFVCFDDMAWIELEEGGSLLLGSVHLCSLLHGFTHIPIENEMELYGVMGFMYKSTLLEERMKFIHAVKARYR